MLHCLSLILLLYFEYALYWINFPVKAVSLLKLCTPYYVQIEKVQFVLSVEDGVELIQTKIQLPNAIVL